jgi:hypothetical protein
MTILDKKINVVLSVSGKQRIGQIKKISVSMLQK